MPKPQRIKKKKIAKKKPITAYTVFCVIMITLVCLILIVGIVAKVIHYFNIHWK